MTFRSIPGSGHLQSILYCEALTPTTARSWDVPAGAPPISILSELTIRRTLQQVDADEVDTILNTGLTAEDLADRAVASDGKTHAPR